MLYLKLLKSSKLELLAKTILLDATTPFEWRQRFEPSNFSVTKAVASFSNSRCNSTPLSTTESMEGHGNAFWDPTWPFIALSYQRSSSPSAASSSGDGNNAWPRRTPTENKSGWTVCTGSFKSSIPWFVLNRHALCWSLAPRTNAASQLSLKFYVIFKGNCIKTDMSKKEMSNTHIIGVTRLIIYDSSHLQISSKRDGFEMSVTSCL